ncbi:hypothetical protein [Palaeococcus ferrophilus]|uniref:hypothetical protein n=1 Tax=Palaeococcus ferrophilus TaxID=83868 RepID=UPI00064FC116|nr:hypothetical protein [Palaeococcus ferrophilus]
MRGKQVFWLSVLVLLLILGAYPHIKRPDERLGEHSFIHTMNGLCSQYFPNVTCGVIAGCLEYKNGASIAFLRVNYTLVQVWNGYEPRGGSVYMVTLDRETLRVLSIEPSNWSEMRETLSMCSPKGEEK